MLDSVDLPLELLIKSGKYNPVVKQIELTMANGNKIEIPIDDLADFYQADEETLTLNEGTKTFSLATKWREVIENKANSSEFQNYLTKKDAANLYVSRVALDVKQDKLINGTNIKSINGYSLLGSGNLNLDGAGGINPDGSTITTQLGSANNIKWYRLAQIVNPSVNSSAKVVVDYYEDDSLVNSTTFAFSSSINSEGKIISEVCPLIRVPNDFKKNGTDSYGSDVWENAGLVNIRIEKSEEGMFLVGLINAVNPSEKLMIKVDRCSCTYVNAISIINVAIIF